MCGVGLNKLKCDACEYAKHTRTSYVSKGIRSISPFMLIHSDVWTCLVTSISGMMKYFVTFIDCYSCMTWVYLLRHKDEVLKCFQNYYAYVETQFKVQVLRSDNRTEYVNQEFGAFLAERGILHQTSSQILLHRMVWRNGKIAISLRLQDRLCIPQMYQNLYGVKLL
jgi:hypothetical protein